MKKDAQKKEEANKQKNNPVKVKENSIKNNENKTTIHNYLWYVIIFSLLGLLIEAILIFTQPENQKGLILGPLCIIYGLGVAIIIAILNKEKGHKLKLFIYGAIIGTVIIYVASFILESIYGLRFWENTNFNINGRIGLEYSIICGILTLLIIEYIKKIIDKIINKIKGKARKIVDIIVTIIIILIIILTLWGIAVYKIRAKETLNGKNYISNNNIIEKFQNTAFSNDIMSKIYPNLQMLDNNGNKILVKDIFKK